MAFRFSVRHGRQRAGKGDRLGPLARRRQRLDKFGLRQRAVPTGAGNLARFFNGIGHIAAPAQQIGGDDARRGSGRIGKGGDAGKPDPQRSRAAVR